MYRSQKQMIFHKILVTSGFLLAGSGITISVIIGIVSSFMSTVEYEDWFSSAIKASAILVWSGLCIGTFSLCWIDLPQSDQSRKYLALFVLNQLTGCVLFLGLMMLVVNIWLDREISGFSLLLQALGWVLMLFVRPTLLSSMAQN